ncbi:hypothetical protein GGR57DRAFT_453116, partial [Xylariaceae sp. FL1272]
MMFSGLISTGTQRLLMVLVFAHNHHVSVMPYPAWEYYFEFPTLLDLTGGPCAIISTLSISIQVFLTSTVLGMNRICES